MTWAFVDYENTGSLKKVDLSAYQRVIVLCGPDNRKFEFSSLPAGEYSRIELIPVTTGGRNNLDFHLAFHLGRFHELAEKSVEFRIISDDAGFDGLIAHLRTAGRKCERVGVKEPGEKPAKKKDAKTKRKKKAAKKKKTPSPGAGQLSKPAAAIRSGLAGIAEAQRPASRKAFVNWIDARLNGLATVNGVTAESIVEELVTAGEIAVAEGRIAYNVTATAKIFDAARAALDEPGSKEAAEADEKDPWDEEDIPF